MRARLQNVVIPCRQYEATLAFYRDRLGLPVLHQGESFCFLVLGGANLALHPAPAKHPMAPTGRGLYLDLVVDDLDAARRELERAGVEIKKAWRDSNRNYLLIQDTEGNFIELIEARDK